MYYNTHGIAIRDNYSLNRNNYNITSIYMADYAKPAFDEDLTVY